MSIESHLARLEGAIGTGCGPDCPPRPVVLIYENDPDHAGDGGVRREAEKPPAPRHHVRALSSAAETRIRVRHVC